MREPIYAIGDIHGQVEELKRVLALIAADGGPDAKIIFLGDYTDRGPESRAVIELLIEGQASARNWTFLKGNHDRMFCWFMQDPPRREDYLPVELSWLHPRLGGDRTLASYGADFTQRTKLKKVHRRALAAVPQEHLAFLQELPLSFQTEEVFFVHAGIRPGVALKDQTEHDLLWIRQEFHLDPRMHPKLIVHGHTPVDQPTHYGNRINLDCGAGYGRPLAAAVFEGSACWHLTEHGRVALRPRQST
ncbi:MAG: metallophosphoesterase family protein [Pseudomonadota bacterium]